MAVLDGEDGSWRTEIATVRCSEHINFWFLPAGDTDAHFDLARSQLRTCIAQWRQRFGYTLISIEPLTHGNLAAKFASMSDGLLIVVGPGSVEPELEEIRRFADLLEVDVVGFIFGRSRSSSWGRLVSRFRRRRHRHDDPDEIFDDLVDEPDTDDDDAPRRSAPRAEMMS